MTQVVSIVPTLMWLQHRFGQSLLGNDETLTQPASASEKTMEFSPNSKFQQGTKLDTLGTASFTDVEAGLASDKDKEGTSTLVTSMR